MIEKFEDIIAWQKSRSLTKDLYSTFNDSHDFTFKNQILRASISVMNNIAEGFERSSKKEFKNFLNIAKGSCGEVRSMLYIAKDVKLIPDSEFNRFFNECSEISKMLSGLMKWLENKIKEEGDKGKRGKVKGEKKN